jgi:hypothetical protein
MLLGHAKLDTTAFYTRVDEAVFAPADASHGRIMLDRRQARVRLQVTIDR